MNEPDEQIIYISVLFLDGLDGIKDAVELFCSLFGRDTITLITQETNRVHIAQSGRTPPILELEIRKFLGICMYMSVINLPQKPMYWARDHRINVVADNMTRDR
jgi:hypothetical protein